MIKHIQFERGGYFFWVDILGYWTATKDRNPPQHCAYASPEAVAKLIGVKL